MRVVESSSRIDLLTPDVRSLNGMNGRQLADAARTHGSEMKMLFKTFFTYISTPGSDRVLANTDGRFSSPISTYVEFANQAAERMHV